MKNTATLLLLLLAIVTLFSTNLFGQQTNPNKTPFSAYASKVISINKIQIINNGKPQQIILDGIAQLPNQSAQAQHSLWRIIGGKVLQITILKYNSYGEIVTSIDLHQSDLADKLVRNGLALPSGDKYINALTYAKKHKLGYWQQK